MTFKKKEIRERLERDCDILLSDASWDSEDTTINAYLDEQDNNINDLLEAAGLPYLELPRTTEIVTSDDYWNVLSAAERENYEKMANEKRPGYEKFDDGYDLWSSVQYEIHCRQMSALCDQINSYIKKYLAEEESSDEYKVYITEEDEKEECETIERYCTAANYVHRYNSFVDCNSVISIEKDGKMLSKCRVGDPYYFLEEKNGYDSTFYSLSDIKQYFDIPDEINESVEDYQDWININVNEVDGVCYHTYEIIQVNE